jgi:hypothetical protein
LSSILLHFSSSDNTTTGEVFTLQSKLFFLHFIF